MAFYIFSRTCRQVIVNYLNIQLAEAGDQWNGFEWVNIDNIVVKDASAYDPRQLPAVVTDNVSGSLQGISFNQTIYSWTDVTGIYGPKQQTYQVLGGRGKFDVSIYCAANDKETQQRVTDLAVYYLTIGRGWMYYNRFMLMGEVRFLGDGEDKKNEQEPIYYSSIAVPVEADWRLLIQRDTIQKIHTDTDMVTPDDPFEVPVGAVGPLGFTQTTPEIVSPLGFAEITPADPPGVELVERKDIIVNKEPSLNLFIESEGSDLPLRPMHSGRKQT